MRPKINCSQEEEVDWIFIRFVSSRNSFVFVHMTLLHLSLKDCAKKLTAPLNSYSHWQFDGMAFGGSPSGSINNASAFIKLYSVPHLNGTYNLIQQLVTQECCDKCCDMENLEWQKRQEFNSKLEIESLRDTWSSWSMYLIHLTSDGMNGITCLDTYRFSIMNASRALFLARFCIKFA